MSTRERSTVTASPAALRPFRFGTGPGRVVDRAELIEQARAVEAMGYATFGASDHFMIPFAPLIALQAVADSTRRLRLTQLVLAQDFRHPAVLAKELATLDVLSEGRLQIGLGAGWMQSEYEQAGLRRDTLGTRIERLEEAVLVLKGLFAAEPFNHAGKHFTITDLTGSPQPVQRPHPPIMIGGGGPRLLGVAARQADIVQIMPPISAPGAPRDFSHFGPDGYQDKVDRIRQAAGARFDDIELGAQLFNLTVTEDPDAAFDAYFERFTRRQPAAADPAVKRLLRSSPMVAIGTLDEVCAQLVEVRARYGISYFTAPVGSRPQTLEPVIGRLVGQEATR